MSAIFKLERPIQFYEDSLLPYLPWYWQAFNRLKYSRASKWTVRRFRPGWMNRGKRKAQVRAFYAALARLLDGDPLAKDFQLVSGQTDYTYSALKGGESP